MQVEKYFNQFLVKLNHFTLQNNELELEMQKKNPWLFSIWTLHKTVRIIFVMYCKRLNRVGSGSVWHVVWACAQIWAASVWSTQPMWPGLRFCIVSGRDTKIQLLLLVILQKRFFLSFLLISNSALFNIKSLFRLLFADFNHEHVPEALGLTFYEWCRHFKCDLSLFDLSSHCLSSFPCKK